MEKELASRAVYRSRIDWFFKLPLVLVAAVVIFSGYFLLTDTRESLLSKIAFVLIVCVVFAIMIHLMRFTFYRFEKNLLHIQSSVFRKQVSYANIREIRRNKTLFIGWKLALATKGLVLHYNKYDVIYISPEDEDEFVAQLLLRNPEIRIR